MKDLYNWKPLKLISGDNVFKIYKVEQEDGSIAVVKKLTLPIDEDDAAKLVESGKILFLQDATNYYVQVMNNEVELLRKLSNEPNILHLFNTYQDQDNQKTNYYIIMEYAEDIISYFTKNGVSEEDIIKLGIDICTALESCKKANIFHNDIKPANIYFSNNYKLGDFGNITFGSDNNIVSFGSPNYLSPEIYNHQPTTESSDLYSLGIVMYQLLFGHLPFVNEKVNEKQALVERMSGKFIPTSDDINSELAQVIIKACSYNEKERYQNAAEMKMDLTKIVNINNEKKSIVFSNSKLNDTISVYDRELIERQSRISQELNDKKQRNFRLSLLKKWIGRISKVVVMVLLLFIVLSFYIFNRTCESGYINRNGICTKGYYYCDSGYSLNEKNQCQKIIKSVDAKVTYSCPSDYTYTNETCVSNDIKTPTFTYQCLDGFKLNGKKCEKTETNDAVITYTCPKGYANMNGVCIKGDEENAKATYSCPSGYNNGPFLENGTYKCSKYVTSSSTIDATVKYSCTTGTLNSNNKCVTVTHNVSKSSCFGTTSNEKCTTTGGYWCNQYPYYGGCTKTCTYTCTVTTEPKKTYTCDNGGTLNGTKCYYSGGNTIKVNATATYTCPKGYERVGTKCIYGKQINGTKKYTCLDSQTRVGDKCYTTVTTDAVGMYTCPTGFVASGVTCIQDDFPQPVKKYTCSRVYTLNGDKCEQYETIPAKAEFTN